MAAWRKDAANPHPFGAGVPSVARLRDLDGPDADNLGCPRSNVLTWWLNDGTRIIARPSGTEPKLKVYLEARAEVGAEGLDAARADAATRVEALKRAIDGAVSRIA